MKKIISLILCALMLSCTAALTVNAAETDSETVSATQYRFKELSQTTLPNNTIKTYTYGLTADNNPGSYASFTNDTTNENYSFKLADCLNTVQTAIVADGNYKATICNGGNIYDRYNFENTGGTYALVKFKLSDFSSYFNEDGTHTQTMGEDTRNYNFTDEGDGNRSNLVILSGGYVNFVAPDKYGYVNAYICKELGVSTYYFTNFYCYNGWSGGGKNSSCINSLSIGKVNNNNLSININDVTEIQKYSAEIEEFNNLQLRNADVNQDGKINIDDATLLQKYIAGLL